MNDQCLKCRIRKYCYYKEPEEDWTCEHYGYFNGLLGEIDKVENGGKEVTNEQIGERLNDAEKVIGESLRILNDIKFAMKKDEKKEVDEAYQRGVEDGRNETWEAVKKISLMSPDEIEKVFPGAAKYNRYNLGYSGVEAIEKLKAYEEKQKAEDDIKLGDELEHTVSGYTSKAIFLEKIEDDEDWYTCLFWTSCGFAILSYPKSQFKRTGKHFDIDKFLEEMRT